MNEVPLSWEIAALGEVTEPVAKVQPSTEPEKEFRYLDISGIDNLTNRISEAKTYRGEEAPSRARQVVREGDVLFSTVRTYLKNIAPVPLAFDGDIASTGFSVLRPSQAVVPKFLFAYTLTPMLLEPLAALQRGSSYPAVREQDVKTQTIPLPPLAEQKRIVAKIEELFSELDAGEESLRRARRQLGVYRQSLLKQAFEGKLTAPWRARHPDLLESPDQLLARIQAERQKRYERQIEEWEEAGGGRGKPKKPTAVKESEVGERAPYSTTDCWLKTVLGNLIDEPAYGTSKKCGYETGSVGVLRIPNVVNRAIDPSDLKFADFDEAEREAYALKAGDLLLIRSNGSVSIVGRCALVETKHEEFLYAGYLIRLRPLQGVIDPRFILNLFSSTSLRSQIESAAKSTSGVNNINSKEIQRLTVPLTSLPEQHEIVRLLDEQFEVIEENEREIDAALKRSEALRQSILKKAFTGQLVPQDPTDEPASVLLDRIRQQRAEAAAKTVKKKTAAKKKTSQKKTARKKRSATSSDPPHEQTLLDL